MNRSVVDVTTAESVTIERERVFVLRDSAENTASKVYFAFENVCYKIIVLGKKDTRQCGKFLFQFE